MHPVKKMRYRAIYKMQFYNAPLIRLTEHRIENELCYNTIYES